MQAHVTVKGEDAADFLQSQFTNELRPFEVGRCVYGLWLDAKGKIQGDSYILTEGDEAFRMVSNTLISEQLVTNLSKHIVADEVEFAIEALGEAYAFTNRRLLDQTPLSVAENSWLRLNGEHYICSAPLRPVVAFSDESASRSLKSALEDPGFAEVSAQQAYCSRLEADMPDILEEVGLGALPAEGGLEAATISFTKGCYLGQEVVARLHNLGRPTRQLYLIRKGKAVETKKRTNTPSALYDDTGKVIGELRTLDPDSQTFGIASMKLRATAINQTVMDADNRCWTVERIFPNP